jgi:septal ring factor EnvC (AmiA/AmiB activator)
MRIFLLSLSLFVSISVFAQTNREIKKLEEQRKQAMQDIANTNKLLNDTKKNTSSLLSRIDLISDQIITWQKIVNLLEAEIKGITVEQEKTEQEIIVLEKDLKEQQKSYAKAVEAVLKNRNSENKLLFILSGKSLSESYRRLRYLKDYSNWRSTQADEITEKSNDLKERKVTLEKTKASKLALLKQREIEQDNLKKEENDYQQEVKEAQKKQKQLQQTLSQKRKQANALNKRIEKLIAEEVARQEREAKRKAKERASANAKGNAGKGNSKPDTSSAKMTDADVKLSSNFASNRGKLPFPVTGTYSISNRFGSHQHSQWRITTSSNGIDIKAQSGAEAKAVFNGEVSKVIAFPGYNNCLIIRHGNYYTFYGNIQSLYVKQGDTVTTGQALGKIYTDPDTNISELHFQLWQGTTKLNPEPWLRR